MPGLILYLLQVNVALVLFYIAYHVALRRLTFYQLNRFFLVFAIVFSAACPFVDLSHVLQKHEELNTKIAGMAQGWQVMEVTPSTKPMLMFDLWGLTAMIFWVGAAIIFLRLVVQLLSLRSIHARSGAGKHAGFEFRSIRENINPFSFWQSIYLNPAMHGQEELLPILRHEQVHVKEWHTLDILLAEAGMLLYWFNPGAWLVKRAIKQNLEFIADKKVLRTGLDRKTYQHSLLRISGLSQGSALSNNFNFFTIKKRIAMMNKKQSSLLHVTRYAVLAPLIAAPILLFTACSEEPEMTSPHDTTVTVQEQAGVEIKGLEAGVVVYLDGEKATNDAYQKLDPKEIHSVNVFKGESAIDAFGDKSGNGVIVITTRENQNSPQVLEFNKKLPALPPPPPPIRSNIPVYLPDASSIHEDHRAFLKRNPKVKQLGWMIGDSFGREVRALVVYLKSGEKETYELDHSYSMDIAENKYGELPALPPPPPPVRQADK